MLYIYIHVLYDILSVYILMIVMNYTCLYMYIHACHMLYLTIYMFMHMLYVVEYMLMCIYVSWIWIELYLMWIGLTQIDGINNCETQLTSDSGTQWHCVLLARLVFVD